MFLIQTSLQSILRNLALKAPIYETKAEAIIQSPIQDYLFFLRYSTSFFQRAFSPAKPSTSFFAESNFALQAAASSCTFCFYSIASDNYLLSTLTFSIKILTFSSTFSNSFFLVSAINEASSFIFYNGITFLLILLNVTILITQEHMYELAKFCLCTFAWVKFSAGSSTYFPTTFNIS